jgi:hypothetical protein
MRDGGALRAQELEDREPPALAPLMQAQPVTMTSAPSTRSAFPMAAGQGSAREVIPESVRKALLVCGVLSSLDYFVAANIVGPLRWEGYSSISGSVSELSAIGAPSRPTMTALFVLYSALVMAFGLGVWASAGSKRALRGVAGLLVAFGAFCLTGPFTPMHQRGAGLSLTDTLHIIGAVGDVLFVVLIIGLGATVFGKRFRLYSIATIVALLSFGALTGLSGPAIAADLPTPWAGLTERICIGAYLLWFAVLAIALLRRRPTNSISNAP